MFLSRKQVAVNIFLTTNQYYLKCLKHAITPISITQENVSQERNEMETAQDKIFFFYHRSLNTKQDQVFEIYSF